MKGTKFPTLESTMKTIISLDCDMVIEYKIKYHPPEKDEKAYWTVSRKFLNRFALGKPSWVEL